MLSTRETVEIILFLAILKIIARFSKLLFCSGIVKYEYYTNPSHSRVSKFIRPIHLLRVQILPIIPIFLNFIKKVRVSKNILGLQYLVIKSKNKQIECIKIVSVLKVKIIIQRIKLKEIKITGKRHHLHRKCMCSYKREKMIMKNQLLTSQPPNRVPFSIMPVVRYSFAQRQMNYLTENYS